MLPVNQITTSQPNYLDISQRPPYIKNKIDSAFINCSLTKWNVIDNEFYDICNIDPYKFIKHIIITQYVFRKHYRVLDPGAGNFNFGRKLAELIVADPEIPNDVKVDIFNLRAEPYRGEQSSDHGKCRVFCWGNFNVENLTENFKLKEVDIKGGFDLIITHYCLRHLVDPVGGVLKTIDLLRSITGVLMGDKFNFLYEEDTIESFDPSKNMAQLLTDTGTSFILSKSGSSDIQFVLRKNSELDCKVDMSYLEMLECLGHGVASNAICRFRRQGSMTPFNPISDNRIYGDKKLFDEMQPFAGEQSPFYSIDTGIFGKYTPLITKEGLNRTSVFEAVNSGNLNLLNECFENNLHLSRNLDRNYPMHLSIIFKQKEIFDRLLEINVEFLDYHGANREKPAHIAARVDSEGYFLAKIVKHEDFFFNDKNAQGLFPLDVAIEAGNLIAIKILMEAGAKASPENRLKLNAPTAS